MSTSFAPYPIERDPTDELLMVEEISHRVVNEYAFAVASLRLEARRTLDKSARWALSKTADRLHMLARAHQVLQLPSAAGEVSLADYLETLCAALSTATLSQRRVRLTILQDEILLPGERCWRVGLIVSELITNAVRHGFKGGAGQILIEVAQRGGEVVCRVSDDGEGVDAVPPPGRGRRLVARLAADLGGAVTWCFRADGSTAVLIFPINNPKIAAGDLRQWESHDGCVA